MEKESEEEVNFLPLISQVLPYYRYWSPILEAKTSRKRKGANKHSVYFNFPVCNCLSVLLLLSSQIEQLKQELAAEKAKVKELENEKKIVSTIVLLKIRPF